MPLYTGRIKQFNFLSFSSNIYERGRGMGFFRNKQYGENRTHVFSQDVTQLQAIHAREIFPCFDQPDMKGTIAKCENFGSSVKFKPYPNH